MFGLDDKIAELSAGASVWVVLLAAVLLGLRHASDPDHLAAVTSLVAGGRERAGRAAAKLGLAWGLGHAITLFAFGMPIVLFNSYLPEQAVQAAEVAIAFVIVGLAARLLYRWRKGALHIHEHEHGRSRHSHIHGHATQPGSHDAHAHLARSPLGAFAIGLVHGMGGSAGVGILIVATVESTAVAAASLILLAVFTAVSMAILSGGFGATLVSRPCRVVFNTVAPVLGLLSLAFGVWYGLSALELTPYYF
jgi:ABC-type nickel/cobalt efflux system permease component RcnA